MTIRRRILIVDDEEQVLFVWCNALRKQANRYQIETAQSGQEALAKLLAMPFDLVITDLRMPGLSGQELTDQIRDICPETTVIWITAYRSPDIDAEAKQMGVTRCLDKPLKVGQIRQVVQQAFYPVA